MYFIAFFQIDLNSGCMMEQHGGGSRSGGGGLVEVGVQLMQFHIYAAFLCVSAYVQILGVDKRSRLVAANAVVANLVADLKKKVMLGGYGISVYECNNFMDLNSRQC